MSLSLAIAAFALFCVLMVVWILGTNFD